MISQEYRFVFQPFQVLTLWDMINIDADGFFWTIKRLMQTENHFLQQLEANKEAVISDSDRENLDVLMDRFELLCNSLGMTFHTDITRLSLAKVRTRIQQKSNDIFGQSYLGFYTEVKQLRENIEHFLQNKFFLYLPQENAKYYEQEDLFGIADKFPEANNEIRYAGNCYATGNYTACVFHLMRGVEYGLRYIAGKLKVPFPKNYENKQWGELIGAIETEIKKIIQKPKSARRGKDLLFYNIAATQFAFIKDAWRNHVMHTRSSYDEPQAMSVMLHVKELMQHIAERKN